MLNLTSIETYSDFENIVNNLKNKTVQFVDKIIKSKKKVLALGASTKGNIILQHLV